MLYFCHALNSFQTPFVPLHHRNVYDYPNNSYRSYTDASGSDELNMKLSQKRAEAVAEFLVKIGKFEADEIQAKGYGETHPVATNETIEGRERNRRIEVLIINN